MLYLRGVAGADTAAYTSGMGSTASPSPRPRSVALLVLEDDPENSSALKQILDSEGWRVRQVPDVHLLHAELRTTEYSLVIANAALVGLDSATFHVLRELASVPEEEGGRIRVLFVLPELSTGQFVSRMEAERLPYVTRPYHLHDFLEKVSELLVEVKAIEGPLRMTRHEFGAARKKKKEDARSTSMFAARDSYSYSEEEITEYERQEAESSKLRRNKPRANLGSSGRE
jgi:DNA-binding response OmpR family regulator